HSRLQSMRKLGAHERSGDISIAMSELRRQIGAYLEHLAHERRASPRTVEHYGRDLEGLAVHLETTARRKMDDAKNLDVADLRGWLGEQARTRASTTVARRISAVKGFFAFLRKRGEVARDPASQLSSPKLRRGLPLVLGAEAASTLVEAPAP